VIIAETVSFVSAFDGLGLLSVSLATSDHLRLPVADATLQRGKPYQTLSKRSR
jgi:hypothetical protein